MKQLLLLIFCFLGYTSFADDSTVVVQDSIIQDTILTTIDSNQQSIQSTTIFTPIVSTQENTTVLPTATTTLEKKKKYKFDRVRLLFGINFSFLNPMVTEKDNFQGSYYPVKDSSPVWTERNTKSNLVKNYRAGNIQFNLQANFWKGLFIGMNYQFLTIKNYKKDPNLGNLLSKKSTMFFIVSAQVGYMFEFLKNKSLQIHPSIRIGGYTADDYYDSGTGKKFYFGTDLQIRYLIKRKAGFSLGVDYDFLHYKKKGYSDIFQKDTYQQTTFSNLHLNAGVYFNISINTKK